MHLLDASAIIYAWDNYPIQQFPKLWEWLAELVKDGDLKIPEVAFEETEKNSPECGQWLKDLGIEKTPITQVVLIEALRIMALLGIEDDKYHSKGVGENDLFIIASASTLKVPLVSNEEVQSTAPQILSKAKIPLVCGLKTVKVPCLSFLQFLKESKEVF